MAPILILIIINIIQCKCLLPFLHKWPTTSQVHKGISTDIQHRPKSRVKYLQRVREREKRLFRADTHRPAISEQHIIKGQSWTEFCFFLVFRNTLSAFRTSADAVPGKIRRFATVFTDPTRANRVPFRGSFMLRDSYTHIPKCASITRIFLRVFRTRAGVRLCCRWINLTAEKKKHPRRIATFFGVGGRGVALRTLVRILNIFRVTRPDWRRVAAELRWNSG